MASKLSGDVIESYLNCRYKAHLNLVGESGTQSDYKTMTMAVRTSSREEAIAKLVARFGNGDACREMAVKQIAFYGGDPASISTSRATPTGARTT